MLPLTTLLSQVLVAFTIEVDDRFEGRMTHFTAADMTARRRIGGVWLASWPMYAHFQAHVGGGAPAVEVQARGRLSDPAMRMATYGMSRWGYLAIEGTPQGGKPATGKRARTQRLTSTGLGREAVAHWEPLPAAVEHDWSGRFGTDAVAGLREALEALPPAADTGLPHYVPFGLYANGMGARRSMLEPGDDLGTGLEAGPATDLAALLSRALTALTLRAEQEGGPSMALAANVLRPLADGPVTVRDLPTVAGVSAEMFSFGLKSLAAAGLVEMAGSGRAKAAALTAAGETALAAHQGRLRTVEDHARATWGAAEVDALRGALGALAGDGTRAGSPLGRGLVHPEGTWRAAAPVPATLPHHPMVSHRGGYPDGA